MKGAGWVTEGGETVVEPPPVNPPLLVGPSEEIGLGDWDWSGVFWLFPGERGLLGGLPPEAMLPPPIGFPAPSPARVWERGKLGSS